MAKDCLGRGISVGDEVMAEIFPSLDTLDKCNVIAVREKEVEVEFFNFSGRIGSKWINASKATLVK